MGIKRKFKIFLIIALMFAIVSLSVGFAAFQKVLNITSTAEVKLPSDENFSVTLYGLIDESGASDLVGEKINPDFTKWSKEKAYPYIDNARDFGTEPYAVINNDTLTIDMNNIVFKNPGEDYAYMILIHNNSDFSIYTSLSDEIRDKYSMDHIGGTCSSIDGASQKLVDAACPDIYMTTLLNGEYKIPAGEFSAFLVGVYYDDDASRVDGSVSVDFPKLELIFDNAPIK